MRLSVQTGPFYSSAEILKVQRMGCVWWTSILGTWYGVCTIMSRLGWGEASFRYYLDVNVLANLTIKTILRTERTQLGRFFIQQLLKHTGEMSITELTFTHCFNDSEIDLIVN